jgi:hypothetical protein
MDTLDFVEVWRTITDSDDYPVLAWEVTDDTDPAFFEVSIDSTNSPIEGGETITIETTVENTGGELNAQEVTSDAESLGSDATTFFLNPGELTTETFSIPTDEGDAGTYTVTVETRDDTDAATLTVTEKDVTKSPVEGVSDDLWTAVTQNDGDDGLSLADLGNAIQVYQNSPDNADVDGVSIGLSDLGALIQYYQSEVV